MIATPGWLTSHTKTPYPFVGPGTPELLEDSDYRTLFVDAFIRYTKPVPYGAAGARDVQLQMTRFGFTGSSESSGESLSPDTYSLTLTWADGTPFLNTDSPGTGQLLFDSQTWGNWIVLEWVYLRDIDDTTDYDRVVRLVLDADRLASFEYPLAPEDAYILPGLVEQGSSKVTTLRFINHGGTENILPDPLLVSPVSAVTLAAGYNTLLSVTPEPFSLTASTVQMRTPARITLDFEPGAGQGKYPGCEEPPLYLRTLNKTGPDAQGHFILAPEDCYFFERVLADTTGCGLSTPGAPGREAPIPIVLPDGVQIATLKLRNYCMPCCKCDDYVDSYNKNKRVWAELYRTLQSYDSVKAEVTALIAAFNERRTTGTCNNVVGRIVSYMKHSWLLTGQAVIYNATNETLPYLAVSLFLSTTPPSSDEPPGPEGSVEGSDALYYIYVPNSAWVVTPESERRVSDAAGYSQSFTLAEQVAPGTVIIFEYEVFFPEQEARVAGTPVYWTLNGVLGEKSVYATAEDYLQAPFNH